MFKMKESFYKNRKEYDKKRSEVTRSSCLFLVRFSKANEISTEFHFLSYWKLKRNKSLIKACFTLRDLSGKKLLSKREEIIEVKSYCIQLKDFMSELKIEEFVGTFELEFFCESDLFISYPAVTVRYFGKNWHTGTHSTARYLSELSGDESEEIRSQRSSVESNISIFSDSDIKCNIILHNGQLQETNMNVELVATNCIGQKKIQVIPTISMKKNETKILSVDDFFDYKSFLKNKRGMLTVKYNSCGVFPRVMFYNEKQNGEMNVEHSNFGNSKEADEDCFEIKDDKSTLKHCFPTFSGEGKNTEIDIFPTYPVQSKPYKLIRKDYDLYGKTLETKEIEISKTDPFPQLLSSDTEKTVYTVLDYSHEEKLPKRFHTAIYYSLNKDTIPSIILDGPRPGYVPGQRTHWAPFFVQKDKLTSKIYLCSRGYEFIKKGTKLDFNISFYGSEEKENFSIKYTIKSEENLELDISEILKGKKWKSNFGWAYIQFTEPTYFKAYFVSEYMKNSIMSNHAF